MSYLLNKLTDLTAINANESGINEALAALSEELGFGLFAFFHISAGTSYAISNYGKAWQSLYFERGFKNIDPVVTKAKSVLRAFSWSWEKDKRSLTEVQKEMYERSSDFGIRSGITIPVRTPNGSMSMFTLASGNDNTCLQKDIDAVAAAAAVGQLHARIAFLQARPTSQEPAVFTPKEATYLRWTEAGKTVEEIAEIEGVKYNTVRINIENAKKRLGVYNITQLTSIAIRRKII
jgi:LuxR family transcriptional activator of conjugal transfer of Ti plasmids